VITCRISCVPPELIVYILDMTFRDHESRTRIPGMHIYEPYTTLIHSLSHTSSLIVMKEAVCRWLILAYNAQSLRRSLAHHTPIKRFRHGRSLLGYCLLMLPHSSACHELKACHKRRRRSRCQSDASGSLFHCFPKH